MALFRPNPSGSGGGGGVPIDTGSFLVTASYAFPGMTFTKGDGSTFTINISQSAVLLQDLLTNITVGGSEAPTLYTSGTLLEDVLRDILIGDFDAEISFTSLIYNPAGTPTSVLGPGGALREVSRSIVFNTASFSAQPHDPGNEYPISASFTASGADTGNFNIYLTNGPVASSNDYGLGTTRTINKSTGGLVTFRINAKEPVTLSGLTTTSTLTYVYPIYYGMSSTIYTASGQLEDDPGITKLLVAEGDITLSIQGTEKYIYFAYPADYGDLTRISEGNGFTVFDPGNPAASFIKYTYQQSGSTYPWSAVNYNVYKSRYITAVNPAQNYLFEF